MVRYVAVRGPVFTHNDVYVTVRRVVAHVIDLIIVGLPLLIVEAVAPDAWAAYAVAFVLIYLLYFGAFQGVTGWTWGKLLVGIRLVNAEGATPGPGPAIRRSLTLFVEVLGVIGLLAVLSSPWRQRAGDRWADTYVTRRFA